MRRSTWLLALPLLCAFPSALTAQTIQNATLRRAQQAFDNLDYRQALSIGQASLRERLTGFERARAYELLGFTYSGLDSILKAVDAFKQVVLIEPERDLDPNRTSPKALSAFQVALTQILVVRQLRVDSVNFIGGQGAVGIRYTVTQPSRVVMRVTGGAMGSMRIDSTVANGQVNIRWPARLPSGDPVPAGNYNVVVEATVGLGYPESVIVGLGVVLLLGTVLYLVPRTAVVGAILLTGYLGGVVARESGLGVDARGRDDRRRDRARRLRDDVEEARAPARARQHPLQLAAAGADRPA